jgi:hypothetical protein
MATRPEAIEDLRIAKMILQIAKDNHYSKVLIYLEDNVRKAQSALDSFDRYSPGKLLEGFFEIVAPRSPKEPLLPFTMDQCTTPVRVVVNYSEPHYV